jgi:hypothetical protein
MKKDKQIVRVRDITYWLVVWNMNFIFSIQLGTITPTDELIFFRGVGIPPTSIDHFFNI